MSESTIWTVSEPRIIELMSKYADDFKPNKWDKATVDHFLELYHYIVRGIQTDEHNKLISSLVKKIKKKRPAKVYSIDELDEIPDWAEREGGVYVNVPKSIDGEKRYFTIYTNLNGSELLANPRFVPEYTQPTPKFAEIETSFPAAFESLVSKYKQYLFFIDETIFKILACAAMTTYFREAFDSTAYYDMYAAELNCGKTTAMLALIWSSCYGFTTVDPTGAVLFRAVDSCHSPIGIDELDNRLTDPDEQGRLLGLLNAGYKKGIVAYRIDMDQKGLPVAYDPFSLKSFSHVNPIPYSIQSRSITFALIRSPYKLPDLETPDIFMQERDMMYKLRLTSSEAVRESYKLTKSECKLANRDAQKFNPLLTMARLVSPDLYTEIEQWANDYVESTGEQAIDEIRRTLVESLIGFSGDIKVRVIGDKFNALCFERELIGVDKKTNEPKKYGSRAILDMLASLGINKSKTRTDNNVHVRILPKRVRAWAEVYGVPIPEESSLSSFASFEKGPAEQKAQEKAEPAVSTSTDEMSFAGAESQSSFASFEGGSISTDGIREMRIQDQAVQSSFGQDSPTLTEPAIDPAPEPADPELEQERSWVAKMNEDNELNEVSSRIRGNESDAPAALRSLVRLWKAKLIGLSDGTRPENSREFNTLSHGLEAGYIENRMPINLYFFTQTALDEIGSYGLWKRR